MCCLENLPLKTPHCSNPNLNMILLSMAITSLSSALVHRVQEGQLHYWTHLWQSQELPVLRTHQISLLWHTENNIPRFCFMPYGLHRSFQDTLRPFTSLLLHFHLNISLSEKLLCPGQHYFTIIIIAFTNILNELLFYFQFLILI